MTRVITTLAFLIFFLTTASAFAADDSWQTLKRLTHRRCMSFATRSNGQCIYGELKNVADDSITVQTCLTTNSQRIDIARKDLLWVSENNEWSIGLLSNTFYDGRNTWQDVMTLPLIYNKKVKVVTVFGKEVEGLITSFGDRGPQTTPSAVHEFTVGTSSGNVTVYMDKLASFEAELVERDITVRVRTADGKSHEGKVAAVLQTGITIAQGTKRVVLARDKIKTVEMLQERPPSDNLEYWGMEMGPVTYLNPEAWGYMMVRGIKLRVRVYDAEAPADVTPVICGK